MFNAQKAEEFITHGSVNSDGNPADPNVFISVYHQRGSSDNFQVNMQIFIIISNKFQARIMIKIMKLKRMHAIQNIRI